MTGFLFFFQITLGKVIRYPSRLSPLSLLLREGKIEKKKKIRHALHSCFLFVYCSYNQQTAGMAATNTTYGKHRLKRKNFIFHYGAHYLENLTTQTTVPTSSNKLQPIPTLGTVTGHRPLQGQLNRKPPLQPMMALIKLPTLLPRRIMPRRLMHHHTRRRPTPQLATPPALMLQL